MRKSREAINAPGVGASIAISGEPLVALGPFFDDDAADAGAQQVAHRQPSAAIGERDDDPIRPQLGDDPPESRQRPRQ